MTAVSDPSSEPSAASTEPGTSRHPGGLARFELPYLVAGGLATVLILLVAVRLPWADDLMLHQAVLRRLIEDPLHPGNPVMDLGGSSIYYSPYMLALALPAKAFGLTAYAVYKPAAVVNVLLLQLGLYRFVRTLSPARWAPPLALIGLLLWWGTSDAAWSGFLSLVSLSDTEAYPSTLATALMLNLWAWLNDRRGRSLASPARAAGIGALLGGILLVHQFTGISAVIGVLAILLARHEELRTKAVARSLGAAAAACGAVVAAWPYYHLWDVRQGELDILDPVHRPLYAHIAGWYGLGLALGTVALALRLRRSRDDVLVLMFVGAAAVVGYGGLSGHWSYGRSWPMAMLAAQLAVAVAVAEARPGLPRTAWGGPVAAVTAVGLLAQAGAFVYVLPHSERARALRALDHGPLGRRAAVDDRPRLAWLDRYLKPTAVVAVNEDVTGFEVAAHGAYDLTTPWYLPEVPPALLATRETASDAIFAPDTAAAGRAALFARYHVSWLLLSDDEPTPGDLPPRPVAHGDGFRLYRVGD